MQRRLKPLWKIYEALKTGAHAVLDQVTTALDLKTTEQTIDFGKAGIIPVFGVHNVHEHLLWFQCVECGHPWTLRADGDGLCCQNCERYIPWEGAVQVAREGVTRLEGIAARMQQKADEMAARNEDLKVYPFPPPRVISPPLPPSKPSAPLPPHQTTRLHSPNQPVTIASPPIPPPPAPYPPSAFPDAPRTQPTFTPPADYVGPNLGALDSEP